MTKNWEVFDRDPRGWEIPNQGVTKVGRPKDQSAWDVLRWELTSFVCEGEYAEGLERILSQYLGNLSRPEQSAAWVSGFYGSGKSHLVRVLASLWTDEKLPDGSTAQGITQITPSVRANLKELYIAGTRGGGLWSAVGKLGSGVTESYRLAFLSVLFNSAGLPSQYPAARLAMMLKREGAYEEVVAALK
ncbi:MAG: BREX system P-loop protein BrxC, partial [Actinobacteria bacterium]|nr:BREX system P-loop protein BrxC [Actinomycetota bacterium]